MTGTTSHPLPNPTIWSAPYWEAAKKSQLVIQSCEDCDKAIMYPRRYCPHCLGENLTFKPAKGTGTIYSLTTQMLGAPSGFESAVPYVIAIIRLDEGVQMMSNIVGSSALDAKIGDPVEVDFHKVEGTETVLPVFRVAGDTA